MAFQANSKFSNIHPVTTSTNCHDLKIVSFAHTTHPIELKRWFEAPTTMERTRTMTAKSTVQGNIPHKHLHSRISYLHQVAAYLTQQQLYRNTDWEKDRTVSSNALGSGYGPHDADGTVTGMGNLGQVPRITEKSRLLQIPALARRAVSHLRGVSLKGQTRLSSAMKHNVCKRCDAFLISGVTSSSYIENKSKGGAKPWADVLVVTCNACNVNRRFPFGARRQRPKLERSKMKRLLL